VTRKEMKWIKDEDCENVSTIETCNEMEENNDQ
jgi:hypothetical protein